MKLAISGIGYVGLSLSVLLAQKNEVVTLDIVQEKVDLINSKKSPITDKEIEHFLKNETLNLKATVDSNIAYGNAEYVIIATPTITSSLNNAQNFFSHDADRRPETAFFHLLHLNVVIDHTKDEFAMADSDTNDRINADDYVMSSE